MTSAWSRFVSATIVHDAGLAAPTVIGPWSRYAPGNPVSSLVCFELFVRPALARLAGRAETRLARPVPLGADYEHHGDRPTYHPAQLQRAPDAEAVEPLPWQGSADLRTLIEADCLAHFPAGDRKYTAGEVIEVLEL